MKPTLLKSWVLAALLALLAMNQPARAALEMKILDFDSAPTGLFSVLEEDGFRLTYIGFGDKQTVVNVGGEHQNILRDPNQNSSGAEIVIRRIDGGVFYFNSLQVNNAGSSSGTYRIDVNAYGKIVQLRPNSLTWTTYSSTSQGTAINSMHINIVSGSALYGVDNINLSVQAVPEPTTVIAGALLLLPFGLSTLRLLRKNRTT